MKNIARKALALALTALTIISTLCGGAPAIKAQAATGVEINETNFPDAYFRKCITDDFDKDGDGVLSEKELKAATFLDVRGEGGTVKTESAKKVTDITGIEYLTYLETLMISNTNVSAVDLSHSNSITKVFVSYCHSLETLDLSGCSQLEYISVIECPVLILEVGETVDVEAALGVSFPAEKEKSLYNYQVADLDGAQITALKQGDTALLVGNNDQGVFGYIEFYIVNDKSDMTATGLELYGVDSLMCMETKRMKAKAIPSAAEFYDEDCADVIKWTSAEPEYVTVDSEGNVRGLKPKKGDANSANPYPGFISIYAESASGLVGEKKVAVTFADVSGYEYNEYYFKPVYWAFNNGITTGKHDGMAFAPFETCTRGQIVTFLWRLAGEPEPTIENPFKDVKSSAYYYKAVLWAYENGITTGRRGGKTFDPNGTCTRREIVTFLWRYAGKPTPSSTGKFTDVTDSSAYYYNAIYWAVEQGITTGKSATGGTTFDPTGLCTRAMAVTFIYRYAH